MNRFHIGIWTTIFICCCTPKRLESLSIDSGISAACSDIMVSCINDSAIITEIYRKESILKHNGEPYRIIVKTYTEGAIISNVEVVDYTKCIPNSAIRKFKKEIIGRTLTIPDDSPLDPTDYQSGCAFAIFRLDPP